MVLRLAEPDPALQPSYLEALSELTDEGNPQYLDMVFPSEPGLPGVDYTLGTLVDPDNFADFCDYTVALARSETRRPAGWVTGTYLWMVEDDPQDHVVGRISLRHTLTPWLLEVGGHIGYAVRPSARGRGYATQALGLMLPVAAAQGIDQVLVTCDETNVASRRVIEANGGVLEDNRNGKLRFWVPTTPAGRATPAG